MEMVNNASSEVTRIHFYNFKAGAGNVVSDITTDILIQNGVGLVKITQFGDVIMSRMLTEKEITEVMAGRFPQSFLSMPGGVNAEVDENTGKAISGPATLAVDSQGIRTQNGISDVPIARPVVGKKDEGGDNGDDREDDDEPGAQNISIKSKPESEANAQQQVESQPEAEVQPEAESQPEAEVQLEPEGQNAEEDLLNHGQEQSNGENQVKEDGDGLEGEEDGDGLEGEEDRDGFEGEEDGDGFEGEEDGDGFEGEEDGDGLEGEEDRDGFGGEEDRDGFGGEEGGFSAVSEITLDPQQTRTPLPVQSPINTISNPTEPSENRKGGRRFIRRERPVRGYRRNELLRRIQFSNQNNLFE